MKKLFMTIFMTLTMITTSAHAAPLEVVSVNVTHNRYIYITYSDGTGYFLDLYELYMGE